MTDPKDDPVTAEGADSAPPSGPPAKAEAESTGADDAAADQGANQPSVAEGSAPKKKKKKKKKREPAADGTPDDAEPVIGVDGAERARFLNWFPSDPELDEIVRAFEVGNYALVRERAPKLAEKSETDQVRAAARELLARIEPDPLMKYLLLGAALLLLFLAFFAYNSQGH